MSNFQRITSIVTAVFMLGFAISLFIDPKSGYVMVVSVLGIALIGYGVGTLIYFFTMARHMVGGKLELYKGVILTEFGYLAYSANDIPRVYVIIYLAVIHLFEGVVEVLRSGEAKAQGGHWKLKFFHGIVDFALAVLCIIYIRKTNTAVFIYAIGLVYSAAMRIAGALRKSVVVYDDSPVT
ncbi:DUF308 domain-containing protein [Butyrivibrio sp. AE2032]|uniref:DUF308 domain-containing protein n=1 Tax=Butyrivibrio sp. AE2032 TaxID=1458463 RepID=UPI00054D8C1E|nr:DUF308 domain-containing protein [Butyrivibrio sp. AE2032]